LTSNTVSCLPRPLFEVSFHFYGSVSTFLGLFSQTLVEKDDKRVTHSVTVIAGRACHYRFFWQATTSLSRFHVEVSFHFHASLSAFLGLFPLTLVGKDDKHSRTRSPFWQVVRVFIGLFNRSLLMSHLQVSSNLNGISILMMSGNKPRHSAMVLAQVWGGCH